MAKDRWITKKKVKFERGEYLYFEKEPMTGVFCLKTGQIAILKRDDNHISRIIGIARPGEIPGASSLIHTRGVYSSSAQAIQSVEACFIQKAEMLDIIGAHPKIAMNFLKMLAAKLADQEPRLRQSVFSHLLNR